MELLFVILYSKNGVEIKRSLQREYIHAEASVEVGKAALVERGLVVSDWSTNLSLLSGLSRLGENECLLVRKVSAASYTVEMFAQRL